jgi:hypothetical protein
MDYITQGSILMTILSQSISFFAKFTKNVKVTEKNPAYDDRRDGRIPFAIFRWACPLQIREQTNDFPRLLWPISQSWGDVILNLQNVYGSGSRPVV